MIYYIGEDISMFNDIDTCSIEYAYEKLKDKKILGLDIETTKKFNLYPNEGLDPYTSKIVMVQIGDEEDQFIIDYRHKKLGKITNLLTDKNIVKVGHNLKFEYKHILHNEGIEITNLYDTMIVEQILFNGKFLKFGLKNLAHRYLDIPMDKETRLGFLTIGSRPFTKKEIQYGADDITIPLKIKKLQVERIKKYDLSACIRLEMLFIPVLAKMELKGINFNKEKWKTLYEKNLINREYIKNKLDEHIIRKYPKSKFIEKQLDLFNKDVKCNINWNSSQQVIELFKWLQICPKEKSKTTGKLSYTVNATVIKNKVLSAKFILGTDLKNFVKLYLAYKEIEQRCSTFGLDFFKYINPITNRIHSDYKQILSTGRISSSSPNLQNIPADKEYRECFDAPEGYKIVNADYTGQEQIILANKSLAPNLIKFYEIGNADMHSYVASKVFNIDLREILYAKQLNDTDHTLSDKNLQLLKYRNLAKGAGFAINYGGTGYTIAKNLAISEKAGDKIYNDYFKAFPGLQTYFTKVQNEAIRKRYILIDKITKRKNFYNPPKSHKEQEAIKRIALNFPIQGEAGSITKFAAILFNKKIKQLNIKNTFITNLVHDEINVESIEKESLTAKVLLEDAMKEAGKLWCKTIPLDAKAVISDYWTH